MNIIQNTTKHFSNNGPQIRDNVFMWLRVSHKASVGVHETPVCKCWNRVQSMRRKCFASVIHIDVSVRCTHSICNHPTRQEESEGTHKKPSDASAHWPAARHRQTRDPPGYCEGGGWSTNRPGHR